jgi:hypothetical protein
VRLLAELVAKSESSQGYSPSVGYEVALYAATSALAISRDTCSGGRMDDAEARLRLAVCVFLTRGARRGNPLSWIFSCCQLSRRPGPLQSPAAAFRARVLLSSMALASAEWLAIAVHLSPVYPDRQAGRVGIT